MKLYHGSDINFSDGKLIPLYNKIRFVDNCFNKKFKKFKRNNCLFVSQNKLTAQQYGKFLYEITLTEKSEYFYCKNIGDFHLHVERWLHKLPEELYFFGVKTNKTIEYILDCCGDISILEIYLEREKSVNAFFKKHVLNSIKIISNNLYNLNQEEVLIKNEVILNKI